LKSGSDRAHRLAESSQATSSRVDLGSFPFGAVSASASVGVRGSIFAAGFTAFSGATSFGVDDAFADATFFVDADAMFFFVTGRSARRRNSTCQLRSHLPGRESVQRPLYRQRFRDDRGATGRGDDGSALSAAPGVRASGRTPSAGHTASAPRDTDEAHPAGDTGTARKLAQCADPLLNYR
jgi:hypothetical protein